MSVFHRSSTGTQTMMHAPDTVASTEQCIFEVQTHLNAKLYRGVLAPESGACSLAVKFPSLLLTYQKWTS